MLYHRFYISHFLYHLTMILLSLHERSNEDKFTKITQSPMHVKKKNKKIPTVLFDGWGLASDTLLYEFIHLSSYISEG